MNKSVYALIAVLGAASAAFAQPQLGSQIKSRTGGAGAAAVKEKAAAKGIDTEAAKAKAQEKVTAAKEKAAAQGITKESVQQAAQERAQAAKAKATESMSAQQKENVAQLKGDLQAIKAGSTVTEEQKTALANSLAACVEGAQKPSKSSVQTLANSLSSAMTDGNITAAEKATISQSVQAVLASAGVSSAEVDALIKSAQDVFIAAGVTQADAQKIANDLKAIASELKSNAPTGTQR